jgi:hypothetical protein
MSRFKTTTHKINGFEFFLTYMGKEVEGVCKWYIRSNEFNLEEYTDSLWATKGEAIEAAYNSTL